eukprot:11200576-Heterocapsa_arctica.AAC.1
MAAAAQGLVAEALLRGRRHHREVLRPRARLKKLGCLQITNQPGAWHQAATSSTLVVYVDDLLMVAGPLHEA